MKKLFILPLILVTAAPVEATKWARPGDIHEPRSESRCIEEQPCSTTPVPFFRGDHGDQL